MLAARPRGKIHHFSTRSFGAINLVRVHHCLPGRLARGIEVFSRELRGVGDLSPAFDDAMRAAAQAAVFVTDNVMYGHRMVATLPSFPS